MKTIIEAEGIGRHFWAELWKYRELLFFLTWRDILVKYKQTVLGISWSLIRPLITMVVFTFIFGRLAKFPSDGMPYSLMVLAAAIPWQLFSSGFGDAGNAMISNANMIGKVYFPRLLLPINSVFVNVIDAIIALAILMIMLLAYKSAFTLKMLLIPLFILHAVIVAIAAGSLVSALNVKYRDFRYIVPFVVQLGMYVTPVGFSMTVVPEKYRLIMYVNPMCGVVDGMRWAILNGSHHFEMHGYLISAIVTLVTLCCGIWYFKNTERYFADVI
jgi:lipopolysaccharide transport system permease protein